MRFRPSLLTKVLLIAFGNFLVLVVAFSILIRLEARLDLESFLVAPVRDRVLAVGRLIALQLAETDPAGWNALIERYAAENQADLRVIDERGQVIAGRQERVPAEILARFVARTAQRGGGERGHHRGDRSDLAFLGAGGSPVRSWAAVRAYAPGRGSSALKSRMWILISSSGRDGLFSLDTTPWLAGACLVILISVAVWLPFVRGLTRAISRMTAATAHIAEGRFDTRLPSGRRDELGKLSTSIGTMAARLDRLVNGQKQFLRDAAHELRSPIGRIQVALGLLERSAPPEQAPVLRDLQEDVQHMSGLVDDVLSYSKLGQRTIEPLLQDVQVARVVNSAMEREGAAGAEIASSIDDGLTVRADPQLLLRALSNLLRNAIRYAGLAGPIAISAKASGPFVVISVADCGPGVPEKELEAIFEPFHRVDCARERTAVGVGLGLAIVRSAIEACSGTVHCRKREPAGLEFVIQLPGVIPTRSDAGGVAQNATGDCGS